MKLPVFPIVGLLALAMASCLPEERVWWSPDGTTAIVRGPDALHLADAGGRLGPTLETGGTPGNSLPGAVDWSPDGKSIVFARQRPVEKWDAVKDIVPKEEAAAAEDLAAVLPAMVRAALAHAPDRSLKDALANLPVKPSPLTEPAARLAYQQDPAGIKSLLQSRPDGADVLAELTKDAGAVTVHELCRWKIESGKPAGEPVVLAASLRAFGGIRISPDGKRIAFVQTGAVENSRDLAVIPSSGGRPALIAVSEIWLAYDWTPGSETLVTATPDGGTGPLTRIERSALPVDGKVEADPVVLARAILLDPPAIDVLDDGRVLFAAQSGTWPVMGRGVAGVPAGLFLAAADGGGVVPVSVAGDAMPADLRFFAASPDGKHVAVVEAGNTAVTVIDLERGTTHRVQEPSPDWECRVMPSWRNDLELTFGGLLDGKPVVKMWSAKSGAVDWSRDWPTDITDGWLANKKDKEMPGDP